MAEGGGRGGDGDCIISFSLETFFCTNYYLKRAGKGEFHALPFDTSVVG